MTFDYIAYLGSISFRNPLVCLAKTIEDERNPILFANLIEKNNLSESIERIVGIIENVHHHVAFASIEAIGCGLLLLPNGAHLSFHVLIFRKIGKLLKFIHTNDNMDTFLFCQGFRKLKNREFVFFLGFKFYVKGHEIVNLVFDNQLGNDSVEELFGVFCPFLKLGRRTSDDLTCESTIELRFRTNAERVDKTYFNILFRGRKFIQSSFYQRRFAPSARRYQHDVNMRCEQLFQ